jgi:ParB-like chromosome segregation protein Spo0J
MIDREAAIRAVIASLTRPDLNPVVKAEKLKRLLEPGFNLSLDQIRERAGPQEQQAIHCAIAVLQQPKEILDLLRNGSLSESHALFLDRIPDVAKRIRMAKKAIKRKWSLDFTWKEVESELHPERKLAKLKSFKREGFELSWNGEEVEFQLRGFDPTFDTVEQFLSDLKEALEFVLDDNDVDIKFSEEEEAAEPPPPAPRKPESSKPAPETMGKVLQLPVHGFNGKLSK